MKQRKYLVFLLSLLALFFIYNFIIYTDKADYGKIRLSEKAVRGENLWLKNNCNSCHQIYGLGGYLGPDLTNVYSKRKKNEDYLKAMFGSGVKSMPLFHFSEPEKEELVKYLKEVDKTGYSPALNAEIKSNGWTEVSYKNEDYE